ncbi:hypothetical protein A9Q87_08100 [Flavobacteriales bacterium 34_180_T64]|nr:hypothetical protein A9Q87_08100 [Flavobacteriales bacterium 34_180_T64]
MKEKTTVLLASFVTGLAFSQRNNINYKALINDGGGTTVVSQNNSFITKSKILQKFDQITHVVAFGSY